MLIILEQGPALEELRGMTSLKREAQRESGGLQYLLPTGLPLCLAFEAGNPEKSSKARPCSNMVMISLRWRLIVLL